MPHGLFVKRVSSLLCFLRERQRGENKKKMVLVEERDKESQGGYDQW